VVAVASQEAVTVVAVASQEAVAMAAVAVTVVVVNRKSVRRFL
jgi:hypothetical protein